jgi:prephenate dehydratase
VAFQGAHGAYSELAALALWNGAVEPVPQTTFDEVFAGVEEGRYECGMVPIENSLAGSIHRNYDLLLKHNLFIIAEHSLRVSHCLIAHPGVSLEEIREVHSHPQALAQCENSLRALGTFQAIAEWNTAGSVELIKQRSWRHAAAIAGEAAAEHYGMAILRRNLEDERANYTRFLALGREPAESTGPCKTSLAFAGKNEPGLLFRCLAAFALRGIDLSKIESRPLRGVPWEYVFYLDFSGSLSEPSCARALEQLREMSSFVRLFGSYPRGNAAPHVP